MFRDDKQKNNAIRTMLGKRLADLWGDTGPTGYARQRAAELVTNEQPGETTMLRVALCVYDASADALFSDIARLPEGELTMVTGLLAVMHKAPAVIDRWIARSTLIDITGDRLIAMKVAAPDHWRRVVKDAIAAAESTHDAAAIMSISLRTFWRWLSDPEVREAFEARGWKTAA